MIDVHITKAQDADEIQAGFEGHLESPDNWDGESGESNISEDVEAYN